MKTTTTNPTAYERTETHCTCSRCGKPCGDDEPGGYYSVDEATIRTSVTRQIHVVVDGVRIPFRVEWGSKATIEALRGERYPEGGTGEARVIDCCMACFEQHAIPALEAAGFSVRTEERNFG